jgi:hypothetical protein
VLSAKKSNFVLLRGPQRGRVLKVEYLGEFDSSFETAEVMEREAWRVLLKKKKEYKTSRCCPFTLSGNPLKVYGNLSKAGHELPTFFDLED